MTLATPIHPSQRAPFLEAVAALLAEHPERGDGLVNRLGREMQPRFMHARPNLVTVNVGRACLHSPRLRGKQTIWRDK
jgi:hypothetical protein